MSLSVIFKREARLEFDVDGVRPREEFATRRAQVGHDAEAVLHCF